VDEEDAAMKMLPKKWLVAAGAVLVSGALATGVAFAASNDQGEAKGWFGPFHGFHAMKGPKGPADLSQLVESGKITQAEADVLKQLQELHQKQMAQLKADSQALIDKAVAEGKITQEQAEKLKRPLAGKFGEPGGFRMHMGGHPFKTEAELKAHLDEKVKSGRLTQEQADQMLKHWQEMHAKQ
jgi:polyhydroxyalkanoate synthesis regulator phasin